MQLSTASETNPHDRFVRDRLAIASRLLNPPADCEISVLQTASLAVSNILEAVYANGGVDIAATAPEAAAETAKLLSQAAPAVADAMEGKMLPERVYFLLGATGGLLTNRDDPYRDDRIDYAAIFAAEMALIYHSRAITERGFPLIRAARINLAWAEPRDTSKLLN